MSIDQLNSWKSFEAGAWSSIDVGDRDAESVADYLSDDTPSATAYSAGRVYGAMINGRIE